jgi:hypothetical protein
MVFVRRLLPILIFLAAASSVQARTWFIAVDGSGDAPTIQAGVLAASPGDTVLVGPGTYTDPNIQIAKDIALVSRDGPSATRLTGASVLITAQSLGSSALIRGFDLGLPDPGGWFCIDDAANALRAGAAVQYACVGLSNSYCEVSSNTVHGGYAGVAADGGAPSIVDNTISHCINGIYLTGTAAVVAGNDVWDCAICIHSYQGTPTISGNSLGGLTNNPCDGIEVGGPVTDTVHISGNTIKNVDANGIYVSGAAVIENNRITNGHRVWLNYAQNTAVTGNVLIETMFDAQYAVATIEQNTIVGGWGIFLGQGTFSRNLAYQCEVHCTFGITLSCNNSWGAATNYSGTCAGAAGANGNISFDPQFCGVPGSGNYYLQADSPCAPGHHPDGASCGLIGAFGVACGPVKTHPVTWGEIKAMYRR